ncbi:PAS domain-containing protein [Massilia norwichensis]|uniref:PAS domain-containing protein n=1 Tax=Massilia norwichensis TaxID=1442366 RepID=A0ABT2A4P6_9BURK|nr:PAS domain-containing protein [Massilia norwichensis]MCS0589129.1 PAS domain-containing protein [Massilia norwichensis]
METRIPVEHFQQLFEAAPGAFLVLRPDAGFTIVGVSDEYLRGTLTRRDQILGRPLFEVFPDNPHTPDAQSTSNLARSLRRVLATRAPDTMAVQRYDVPAAGGGFELRYWSPVNAPVLGPDGSILYIIHRVDNVTAYVQLSREHAQERRASQRLSADRVRMEAEIVERSRELDRVNAELQSANDVLSEYADRAREQASNKDEFLAMLALELPPAGQAYPMLGDATRLEQVLANLLANAAKYSEAGGRVAVALERYEEQGLPGPASRWATPAAASRPTSWKRSSTSSCRSTWRSTVRAAGSALA